MILYIKSFFKKIKEGSSSSEKIYYRRDIDGLRAIAIIAVVLFHARIFGASGGYVGVDVFFVISGFLITSVILKGLKEDSFSFLSFYAKRIRRLLPAIFVALMTTTILAYLFLSFPEDLKRFGISLFAQGFFLSNVYFYISDGYFAAPVENYPLLHTWSLSIEEQFYLFFPLLLFLLFKYKNKLLKFFILTIGVISLLYSIYLTNIDPFGRFYLPLLPKILLDETNITAAFFLLPSRIWELMLGSLIVVFNLKIRNKLIAEIASLVGLILILISIFYFNPDTYFPGFNAILPAFGSALIIVSGISNFPRVNKFLSLKPFVWTGLISYSLYLWHWPIFVFARKLLPNITTSYALTLITLSFFIAWLSYLFVENPFRKKIVLKDSTTVIAGIICLLAISYSGYLVKDFETTSKASYIQPLLKTSDLSYLPRNCNDDGSVDKGCDMGDINNETYHFVLWGDSHAEMYYPVISEITKENGIRGKYFASEGCEPIQGVSTNPRNDACEELKIRSLNFIEDNQIKNVIIIARWGLYVDGASETNKWNVVTSEGGDDKGRGYAILSIEKNFQTMLKKLVANNVNVYVFRQVPFQSKFDSREIYYKSLIEGALIDFPKTTKKEHLQNQQFMDNLLKELEIMGVTVIDPTPLFCAENDICQVSSENQFYYRDTNHLTLAGAEACKTLMLEKIDFEHFK